MSWQINIPYRSLDDPIVEVLMAGSTAPLALRPELDRLRCDEPGCDCDGELVLFGRCHHAPVWAPTGRASSSCAAPSATDT